MAATRLKDAQKLELVDRFRGGAGTQELATAYGCSPNTVIRVVKAAIEPALYEELKRQRGRRAGQAPELSDGSPAGNDPFAEPPPPPAAAEGSPVDAASVAAPSVASPRGPETPEDTDKNDQDQSEADQSDADQDDEQKSRSASDDHEAAGALAIEDADDFDDLDGEAEDEEDSDGDQDDDNPGAGFIEQTFVELPISLGETLDQPLTTPRPWRSDELPSAAYLLVDKTVELQPRPLAEITELGRLEAEEQGLQALVLYSNPRQAKRHCGRTQRVIKLPDVGLLERRAPYLLRQGIRRVVIEGALYALPEG